MQPIAAQCECEINPFNPKFFLRYEYIKMMISVWLVTYYILNIFISTTSVEARSTKGQLKK